MAWEDWGSFLVFGPRNGFELPFNISDDLGWVRSCITGWHLFEIEFGHCLELTFLLVFWVQELKVMLHWFFVVIVASLSQLTDQVVVVKTHHFLHLSESRIVEEVNQRKNQGTNRVGWIFVLTVEWLSNHHRPKPLIPRKPVALSLSCPWLTVDYSIARFKRSSCS